MRKRPSKLAHIFSRSVPDERLFAIAPPMPVTRDIPLSERLAAYKQAKRPSHKEGA